jgi:hypothetical protein
MPSNLERIPGYDDVRAEAIIRRAHDGVIAELMNDLDRRDIQCPRHNNVAPIAPDLPRIKRDPGSLRFERTS